MGTFMFVLIWSFTLVSISEQSPSFVITAPKLIHLEVPENVAVQVQGVQNPIKMTLYLENPGRGTHSQKCSQDVVIQLPINGFYETVVSLKITKQQADQCQLFTQVREKYLHLVAESSNYFSIRKVPIRWSTRRGYLFIQTDKPIYTPNERVQFRVFTLDHMMKPTEEAIALQVFNSRDIQVMHKEKFSQNSIISEHFMIPDIAESGIWRIMAYFSDSPMSNVTTEFEVKKFVLPAFEVKIIPNKMYYSIRDPNFSFWITVLYTYGEAVNGVAYLRFAIIDQAGNTTFLKGLEQQAKVTDGKCDHLQLNSSDIEKKLNKKVADLEGFQLYIAVTMVETASGEMEEAEIKVKIVSSPYNIDLSRTKRFFSPGNPFHVVATVSTPDGTLLPFVQVKLQVRIRGSNDIQQVHSTNKDGLIEFPVNIPISATELNVKLTVGEDAEMSISEMVATIYKSDSKSYLYINVPQTIFKLSDPVRVILQDVTPAGTNVDYFYYLIISKGRILDIKKIARTLVTVVHLHVEENMIPSFRFVAYYYRGKEIVADSVWVDVIDRCAGKLELKPSVSPTNYHEPGSSMTMGIYTSGAASVSLVAVDTAVYILNKKNKLSSNKVFAAMNSYDLGCTVGSGQNNLGVFSDAGLSILSDTIQSDITQDYSCKSESRRQKRSLQLQPKMQGKVDEYPDNVKKCCSDGMAQIKMRLTCEQRASRIKPIYPVCKKAFLECCQYAEKLRAEERKRRIHLPGLARTFEDWADEQDFFDESAIVTRTVFPQSWLWKTVNVKDNGEYMHRDIQLPDSITTWEVQAVSLSKTKGICIAEPVTIKAFKKFHISLRLPYSVKRFEQLEIRAVLYNYHDGELKFTIIMKEAEGICNSATSSKGIKQELTLGPKSAKAVYFSVVPMKVGNIPIHILAYDSTFGINDGILKTLRVVGEGVTKIDESTFHVNPEGKGERSFTIDEDVPPNVVPEAPYEMYVRVSGEMSEETVDNCLDPGNIDKFIRVPNGCAEQTMIYMSPAVSTIEYLDQSEQWLKMKPERKQEALKIMQMGYNRILEYKKDDGSYGAWKHHPSSTWLTAFVAKVLSRVSSYIYVDKKGVIHAAVNYLLKLQNDAGAFTDPNPVIHREMQGGIGGTEERVSLTSFVIIALYHVNKTYADLNEQKKLQTSIERAVEFLKQRLPQTESIYTLAISAYALTLIEPDSSEAKDVSDRLDRAAKYDKEKDTRHWEIEESKRLKDESRAHLVPKSSALGVEVTAYALLHTLLLKDIIYANSIVKWLTEQKNYGGGFYSTQDTVVAMEALAQYFIMIHGGDETNMEVQLSSPARSFKKTIMVTKAGRSIQEDLQFPLGTKINVDVRGKGKGAISIMRLYNVIDVDNSTCTDIKIEVTLRGEVKYEPEEYDYDYGDAMADEPFSKISWFDRRNRRRREAAAPGSSDKPVIYDICIWRDPKAKVSGMAIADITMLSGFEPNSADLDKLVSLTEQYISHYEFKEGRLLLYFDEIPKEKDCISFEAKQILPIGLLQPTSASLYDFYEPGQKCIVFYNAPDRSTFVNTLCSDDVCQCAEGPCPIYRKTFDKGMTEDKRMSHACYSPIVEYGYKVKVLRTTQQNSFEVYMCEVVEPLRTTKDSKLKAGDFRYFLKRRSCKLQLSPGKEYLLMGNDGKTSDASKNVQYLLDSKTWIEEIPEDRKCRGTAYRPACNELQNFLTKYEMDGCAV
ncbi:complement C4-B isoform X2 [Protopterus annectens]|uniref:complement C4-B isoform X2 n=1 Tax=Protopterus annectens TaxID=7888 RepID=UPI001CFA1021|nr:complement C4-B isoform X2 [Protopterus annectens]